MFVETTHKNPPSLRQSVTTFLSVIRQRHPLLADMALPLSPAPRPRHASPSVTGFAPTGSSGQLSPEIREQLDLICYADKQTHEAMLVRLTNVEESLRVHDHQFQSLHNNLNAANGRIDANFTTLRNQIDNVNTRIDDVETTLTARIDNVETTLTARIDNVEANLTAKIDNVQRDLQKQMNTMQAQLASILTALTSSSPSAFTISGPPELGPQDETHLAHQSSSPALSYASIDPPAQFTRQSPTPQPLSQAQGEELVADTDSYRRPIANPYASLVHPSLITEDIEAHNQAVSRVEEDVKREVSSSMTGAFNRFRIPLSKGIRRVASGMSMKSSKSKKERK